MMQRCLITGASGFVGSNLAQRLCKDLCQVRCLVRSTSRLELLDSLSLEFAQGSLDDAASLRAAVKNVDVVFHLAGRVAALKSQEFIRDNVEGTRLLAQVCAEQASPPVLVMVSSLAAGGVGTMKSPRRETDPDRPVSAYGRSKLAAEQAALAAAPDLSMSFIRPPMVFGQGDRASLQMFRGMKLLPVHLSPGFRRFPISLVHVADLCDALVRIAQRAERTTGRDAAPPPGQGRYYIAADRHVTYGQMGLLAAQAAGWRVATLPLPKPIFWFAGAMGELAGRRRGRAGIVNWDKAREATAKGWVCSDEKLRTQLGYRPAATLEERFAETVAWYRQHGWL
ncbi:MAG: NAD-dependent epimerase/dehydratase family protein [Pirellulales bacterium]|nr:NAD-dependent epimerase/dehydratase family protein [Pirellulales bacterium]